MLKVGSKVWPKSGGYGGLSFAFIFEGGGSDSEFEIIEVDPGRSRPYLVECLRVSHGFDPRHPL